MDKNDKSLYDKLLLCFNMEENSDHLININNTRIKNNLINDILVYIKYIKCKQAAIKLIKLITISNDRECEGFNRLYNHSFKYDVSIWDNVIFNIRCRNDKIIQYGSEFLKNYKCDHMNIYYRLECFISKESTIMVKQFLNIDESPILGNNILSSVSVIFIDDLIKNDKEISKTVYWKKRVDKNRKILYGNNDNNLEKILSGDYKSVYSVAKY